VAAFLLSAQPCTCCSQYNWGQPNKPHAVIKINHNQNEITQINRFASSIHSKFKEQHLPASKVICNHKGLAPVWCRNGSSMMQSSTLLVWTWSHRLY